MPDAVRQLCFVDMPFGVKTDPRTRVEIDFDQIYAKGIQPAIDKAGLDCIRGDEERTGGIIHKAMFARLLLAEFVVADLTTANANVFYELGVRHTARPFSTIPIFATLGAPPFDVNMVRAIPYDLEDGRLTDEAAQELVDAIGDRIRRVVDGPIAHDSPLFQLFDEFPGIEMSHELTDVFRDRVSYSDEIRQQLRAAREAGKEHAVDELKKVEEGLGDLKTAESGVLVDLLLSYRDVSAWARMIALYDELPSHVRDATLVRQQFALALNRAGDRKRAIEICEGLLDERGASAETYGILGRVYKDQYKDAKEAGKSLVARGLLDRAIETYTKGFECEPLDYYPGVNAINLLVQKGDESALAELERLTPLVTYAVARKGGAASTDYWDLATVLELAIIGRDDAAAAKVLPRILGLDLDGGWMAKTTSDNLALVLALRKGKEDVSTLEQVLEALRDKQANPGIS